MSELAGGNRDAHALVSYFVGQGVGLVDEVRHVRQVVHGFREEFLHAVERLQAHLWS